MKPWDAWRLWNWRNHKVTAKELNVDTPEIFSGFPCSSSIYFCKDFWGAIFGSPLLAHVQFPQLRKQSVSLTILKQAMSAFVWLGFLSHRSNGYQSLIKSFGLASINMWLCSWSCWLKSLAFFLTSLSGKHLNTLSCLYNPLLVDKHQLKPLWQVAPPGTWELPIYSMIPVLFGKVVSMCWAILSQQRLASVLGTLGHLTHQIWA